MTCPGTFPAPRPSSLPILPRRVDRTCSLANSHDSERNKAVCSQSHSQASVSLGMRLREKYILLQLPVYIPTLYYFSILSLPSLPLSFPPPPFPTPLSFLPLAPSFLFLYLSSPFSLPLCPYPLSPPSSSSTRAEIWSACWSPEDTKVATCSEDQTTKIWRTEDWQWYVHHHWVFRLCSCMVHGRPFN